MKKIIFLCMALFFSSCSTENQSPMMQDHIKMSNQSQSSFSQDVTGLDEAKKSEIIDLKDGDTLNLSAEMLKQTVGNRIIKRLGYNGQIPGPLLRIQKNAKVTVILTNNIDVDTTMHSHGLRLDNRFDGVPDVTQDPIKPGESFSYTLKFPDEGIYWYHAHIREDYTQELGMYGNFLVQPDQDDYWNVVDREEILILDDILIGENGIPDFSKDYTNQALMGRFGNIMLINNEERFEMKAKKGERIRLYVTNVASTRTFNFSIPNVQMKLVGGDIGRIEKEEWIDSFIIAPAERYIFEVLFSKQGEYVFQHLTPNKTYQMGKILVSKSDSAKSLSGDFNTLRSNNIDYSMVRQQFDAYIAKEPEKKLRLSVELEGMMKNMSKGMMKEMDHEEGSDGGIEWEDDMAMMNSMSNSKNTKWKLIDEETGKENMDIDWKFKQGDLVKIRIFNDPKSAHPMQHPIHFHGQRFIVLSRNEKENSNLQWKDTTLVKNGETVDILLEISNPGTWMAHCHMAEHLHAGMMMSFEVYN